MRDPFGFIYVTTNILTGKKYVGQSRYNKPKWENYLGSGKFLLESIAKHGRDNFRRVIICEADSREELCELESYFIKKFDAVESRDFYNIADGGYATRGFTGKTHSPERNSLLSERMMGHSVSKRVRENMSQIGKEYGGEKHYRSRKVTIDGQTFPTITVAMRETCYKLHDIRHFLATGEHPKDRKIRRISPTCHTL